MEITQEYVKKVFAYDPEGFLIWTSAVNNQHAGKKAGYIQKHKEGYLVVDLFQSKGKKTRYVHRLVFLWHHGYLPKSIDHVNRIKTDNRIENLREATPMQQNANKPVSPLNKIGLKGVEQRGNKYVARIHYNRKRKYVGRFDTPEEAHAAYLKAAKEVFGEFASA